MLSPRGEIRSVQLSWEDLGKQDIPSLHRFSCIYPARVDRSVKRRPKHARSFQVVVQSFLRNLKPRLSPPRYAFGARLNGGLCAIVVYRAAQARDAEPAHFVSAFARSSDFTGGLVADAAMRELLRRLRAHNIELGHDPGILCKIHVDNRAAKKLFQRHGFERIASDGENYCLWGRADCN